MVRYPDLDDGRFRTRSLCEFLFLQKIFAKYTPADPTTDEDPDNWNLDEIEKTELDVKEDVTASTEATDAAASSKDETKPE